MLAGANCGACGCAGCADYAKSIVEDGNAVNKCTPGGAACAWCFSKARGRSAPGPRTYFCRAAKVGKNALKPAV